MQEEVEERVKEMRTREAKGGGKVKHKNGIDATLAAVDDPKVGPYRMPKPMEKATNKDLHPSPIRVTLPTAQRNHNAFGTTRFCAILRNTSHAPMERIYAIVNTPRNE